MNCKSNTPRTDAWLELIDRTVESERSLRDFARQLETELYAAQDRAGNASVELASCKLRLERQVEELTNSLVVIEPDSNALCSHKVMVAYDKLMTERDQLRAQLDEATKAKVLAESIICHAFIHSNYSSDGFWQITTDEKQSFCEILERNGLPDCAQSLRRAVSAAIEAQKGANE